MQVLFAVRIDILNKVIVKNQTNLIRYLYYIILDIRELNLVFEKYSKKTRAINLYNIKIGFVCV